MTMSGPRVQVPGFVAGTWDIDPVHSEIGFSVRHMMVSKVRGRFTGFAGSFVTAEDPAGCSAAATIENGLDRHWQHGP